MSVGTHSIVALSINSPAPSGKIEHYRVYSRRGKLTIDEEGFFQNLPELVEVWVQIPVLDILSSSTLFSVMHCQ